MIAVQKHRSTQDALQARLLPKTFCEGFHDDSSCQGMLYHPLGNTGLDVSTISLGTSSFCSTFSPTNVENSIRVVQVALRAGVNYIDTAPWYGQGTAETILGKALVGIPRNSYYISSKVCRYEVDPRHMFDFSPARVGPSIQRSLQRLGLTYLDIIIIHDVEFCSSPEFIAKETVPALLLAKSQGLVRHIGISGYNLDTLRRLVEMCGGSIDVVLTYCRYTLFNTDLTEYYKIFQEHGVGVINASPIGMGLLTLRGPPAWHPAPENLKRACAEATQYCQRNGFDISRLALGFCLRTPPANTTMFSVELSETFQQNLSLTLSGLSDSEHQFLLGLIDRFFRPLESCHWEGLEVKRYWSTLRELFLEPGLKEPCYPIGK